MAIVSEHELRPGLVVYLDTDVLRQRGGSATNAEVTGTEDRAVEGPHQFLVLQVDREAGTFLATPLFSNRAPGSLPLDDRKKVGSHPRWTAASPYYFSRWQHWIIPLDAVPAASEGELSEPGDRSAYALTERELSDIAAWGERNRAPLRNL